MSAKLKLGRWVDPQEVMTDTAGMLTFDTVNNLTISNDIGLIGGIAIGNIVYQNWGKWLMEEKMGDITLSSLVKGTAEGIAKTDIEFGIGLKGFIYSLSIYLTSIAYYGADKRRPLATCILDGYAGGELGGYLMREYLPVYTKLKM